MRFILDVDYLAIITLSAVLGIVGITATANIHPNITALATCNCNPGILQEVQELSVILLAIAIVLTPVGMLRSTAMAGAPKAAPVQSVLPSGRTYTAPPLRSGELLALGVSLVVLGVAVVGAPSFLVLKNWTLVGEAVVMVLLGIFLAYRGGRSSAA